MTSEPKSALVVGGGVIGLTTAFRLAEHGHAVTLFDPSPGRGATWAAAGMIAPSAEISPGEHANYQLQRGALGAWRELREELRLVTDRDLLLSETGTLLVGWDVSDRRQIEQFDFVAREFGADPRRVTRDEQSAAFEGVSGRISEGLLISGDGWLNPDEAVAIITDANRILKVTVINDNVVSVASCGDHVEAETSRGSHRAHIGILATGADALPAGITPSGTNTIRPVHGVTVRVGGLDRSAQPTIRAFVRGHAFYMVSRPGGYNVLGATAEERSQPDVRVGEVQRLLRDALDIVPTLETATLLEMRSGLRPASANLQPFFEVLDGGRWAWSSGHYRHGVTLAPIAANDAVHFMERCG